MAKHNDHTMQVRLPESLWTRFRRACLHNDVRPSEVVREMIRAYAQDDTSIQLRLAEVEQTVRQRLGREDASRSRK